MSKLRAWAPLVGVLPLLAGTIGCVSRDEYLRTDFARRKAVERCEVLERDLADERAKALALEQEREGLQREVGTNAALASTLRDENSRIAEMNKKMQRQMDDVLARGMNPVEVVQVRLPADLDRALKELAAKHPDAVEYDSSRGAVRWKSDLTFEKGSDEVRSGAQQSLQEFARIVASPSASQFEVIVVGHTDNLPIGPITGRKHPTNWNLSTNRAVAVVQALHRFGLDYTRMGAMGYGEHHPRVPNNRGGSEENRRVEIFLVGARDGGTGGMAGVTPRSTINTRTTSSGNDLSPMGSRSMSSNSNMDE